MPKRCGGRKRQDTGAALSAVGKQFMHEINNLRVVVGFAHATQKTPPDTLTTSSEPAIYRRTSTRAMVKNFQAHAESRYLTDEQIKAIAAQRGRVGIFFSANRALKNAARLERHLHPPQSHERAHRSRIPRHRSM